jgi:uncharacterized protein (TIGR02596 family)
MRCFSFSSHQTHSLRRDGRVAASVLSELPCSRRGFSLVEILTVIAIITVMAVLSLPSITSLRQSGSLTAGGNELSDLAVMAQQYAVSHNVMTALVGVTGTTTVPNAQNRAFVVIASDSTGNNWAPVCKWTLLPDSVVMASSSSINTFIAQTSPPAGFPSTLTLNGTSLNCSSGSGGVCSYQLFYPDGQMDTSAPSVILPLVSAQNVAATALPQNYYELIFNPNTGTVKIKRS